jgi:hypothetical protein
MALIVEKLNPINFFRSVSNKSAILMLHMISLLHKPLTPLPHCTHEVALLKVVSTHDRDGCVPTSQTSPPLTALPDIQITKRLYFELFFR